MAVFWLEGNIWSGKNRREITLQSKNIMQTTNTTPKLKMSSRLPSFVCYMLTIVGTGLLIAGFAVNPRGEIHSSILIAYGETLAFVAALFGINFKSKI